MAKQPDPNGCLGRLGPDDQDRQAPENDNLGS